MNEATKKFFDTPDSEILLPVFIIDGMIAEYRDRIASLPHSIVLDDNMKEYYRGWYELQIKQLEGIRAKHEPTSIH